MLESHKYILWIKTFSVPFGPHNSEASCFLNSLLPNGLLNEFILFPKHPLIRDCECRTFSVCSLSIHSSVPLTRARDGIFCTLNILLFIQSVRVTS
ncbi:hypothetical protein I7I53_09344 [Histoplasma capsulatum var. duboisii H88]|uniref:Uncharacterized protein n=1 Tax=Ajellomyces capsulatus (strain H88) TaxID=544711 RepID=A0A8A1L8T7_AJEC8|nr:hypothetical protein I7I53_09344 [Histoplasma capsulatum var. duboisii H88]